MRELQKGEKVRFNVELTFEGFGTRDCKLSYLREGGLIYVYVPKEIVEVDESPTATEKPLNQPSVVAGTLEINKEKEEEKMAGWKKKTYTCTCGAVYDKPIYKAMCVRRNHKPKEAVNA